MKPQTADVIRSTRIALEKRQKRVVAEFAQSPKCVLNPAYKPKEAKP